MISRKEDLDHAGFLQKRRGGFGKFAVDSWKARYFTITKAGLLTYYENDDALHSMSSTEQSMRPRGRIDLRAVNFDFLKDIRSEGAPTSYVMQICPPNEEKWALCAPNRDEYLHWCSIFERLVREKVNQSCPTSGISSGHQAGLNYASEGEDDHRSSSSSISGSPAEGRSRSGSLGDKLNASNLLPRFVKDRLNAGSSRSVTPTRERSTSGTSRDSDRSLPSRSSGRPEPSAQSSATNANTSSHTDLNIAQPHQPSRRVSMGGVAGGKKKGIKVATKKASLINVDAIEWLLTLIIMNFCFYMAYQERSTASLSRSDVIAMAAYLLVANAVVGKTLSMRSERLSDTHAQQLAQAKAAADESVAVANGGVPTVWREKGSEKARPSVVKEKPATAKGGKPAAGSTFEQSLAAPRQAPDHTWCKCDHRQFQVRVGPNYDRFKKKAPSLAPLYDIFAVDVFCTKSRCDHATQQFQLPDTSNINTYNAHVPPIFVVQIQIPADPPPSLFSSVEDGQGWSILMYYRVTEDTCRQLKDIATASPAVKLFAQWCEKAPNDAAWRGRFKVINSCTNLEELGMPSAIVQYNAKPVLIRRTGTIFKGPNYIEFNIHVHKFANLAKQSIHLITSRCNLMYMQIGFVIEGRDDKELPEVLFACVAVNKPQEDNAEFLFEDADS